MLSFSPGDQPGKAQVAPGIYSEHFSFLKIGGRLLLGADLLPQQPLLPSVLDGIRQLDFDLSVWSYLSERGYCSSGKACTRSLGIRFVIFGRLF